MSEINSGFGWQYDASIPHDVNYLGKTMCDKKNTFVCINEWQVGCKNDSWVQQRLLSFLAFLCVLIIIIVIIIITIIIIIKTIKIIITILIIDTEIWSELCICQNIFFFHKYSL